MGAVKGMVMERELFVSWPSIMGRDCDVSTLRSARLRSSLTDLRTAKKLSRTLTMTGTMPAWTTRLRTCSVPRTPTLTTHWKARVHLRPFLRSLTFVFLRIVTRRSSPPSRVINSRMVGVEPVRYARLVRVLMMGM